MNKTKRVHMIGMSGAGREVANAAIFETAEAMFDWLYAYAKINHESERKGKFDSAFEVDAKDPADRKRAAVEWANETAKGEWYVASKAFSTVGSKGEPLDEEAEVTMLDEEFLATLKTGKPSAAP